MVWCPYTLAPGTSYHTILYYTILYYTILYYTILYYTILYYTILYYTILYYTILYYTIIILYHLHRGAANTSTALLSRSFWIRSRRSSSCMPKDSSSSSTSWWSDTCGTRGAQCDLMENRCEYCIHIIDHAISALFILLFRMYNRVYKHIEYYIMLSYSAKYTIISYLLAFRSLPESRRCERYMAAMSSSFFSTPSKHSSCLFTSTSPSSLYIIVYTLYHILFTSYLHHTYCILTMIYTA